jgi:hypothetical protein
MFASGQKATGTEYTATVAFLVVAFLFSPAILFFFRPLGYLSVSLAIGCSALCVALALVNWKKASQLTIPSIEDQGAK